MAWIEMDDNIWEHRKTIRLCGYLGISEVQAVGHLIALWHFTLRNAWRDADMEPWGEIGIERAAKWTGAKGAFVEAARKAEFIDGFIVHGWVERAGKLVQDRLYNEERKAAAAEKYVNAVKRRKSAFVRRKTDATQPNPTQPNQGEGEGAPPASLPDGKYPEADILAVAEAYADIKGVSLEGEDARKMYLSSGEVYFPAKDLLYFANGSVQLARHCILDMRDKYVGQGKPDWPLKWVRADFDAWNKGRIEHERKQQ